MANFNFNPLDFSWGNDSMYSMGTFDIPTLAPTGSNTGTFNTGFRPSFFDKANLALSGIGALGNLYGAIGSLGLARRQFNFQKDFAERNLANQTQSYNTALADRARARAAFEGQSDAERDRYITANSLRR